MDYKVLVNIFVPETEQVFEMYIPINKTVSQVLILAIKLINNITCDVYPIKTTAKLYNRRTKEIYDDSVLIRDTTIRNGSQLIIK